MHAKPPGVWLKLIGLAFEWSRREPELPWSVPNTSSLPTWLALLNKYFIIQHVPPITGLSSSAGDKMNEVLLLMSDSSRIWGYGRTSPL
jgi:hypothetical protein